MVIHTIEAESRPLTTVQNAFHNVCRHRGHPVTTKESGSTTVLACRFHGWQVFQYSVVRTLTNLSTYLPNGALHTAREYTSLPDFSPAEHSLYKIHTHVTPQGFIFINFDASPTPSIPFENQFGDDFSPTPSSPSNTNTHVDEYELFSKDSWTYDHTWESSTAGTLYNWKTFADGFQECYHCATEHPSTLPRDFALSSYYLRQGFGASRHFLPPKPEKEEEMGDSYITWLYPIGAIIFTGTLMFIARFDARGALDTRYQSERYRKKDLLKPCLKYDEWITQDVGYWRFVEVEDVELAVAAQGGFMNGVLGRGRLHSVRGKLISLPFDSRRGYELIRWQNMP